MLKTAVFPNSNEHEIGLFIEVDDRIPGYSCVMTVPACGDMPEMPARPLWVISFCPADYRIYLREREEALKQRPSVKRAYYPEFLAGISSADVVVLPGAKDRGDWSTFEALLMVLKRFDVTVIEHEDWKDILSPSS